MSHEVETMAYTNEVPWHGLGVQIDKAPNVKEMMKLADLNWKVERQPMFLKDGTEVKGFASLVRSKDKSILDVVGSKYVPIQNDEAFDFFCEYVEAGDATMETAGSLRGGRYVWGLANLKRSFKLKGNDEVKGYLLVGAPHEQGKAFIIKMTSIRVVCNNTLSMALRAGGASFRMAHRREFTKAIQSEAKATLGIAREQFDEFKDTALKLQSKKMTRKATIDLLTPIFAPKIEELDFDDLPPRLEAIMQCLEKAPGAQPGNAWGVLNAVTYYADHVASLTSDKRMTNAWFGKTASQKDRVLKALLRV